MSNVVNQLMWSLSDKSSLRRCIKGQENKINIFIQSIYLLYIVHILISYIVESSVQVW